MVIVDVCVTNDANYSELTTLTQAYSSCIYTYKLINLHNYSTCIYNNSVAKYKLFIPATVLHIKEDHKSCCMYIMYMNCNF